MMKDATKENWNEVTDKGLVLVKFGAEWCGPCKALKPILEKVHNEIPHIDVVNVDIDQQLELASALKVTSVPTMMLFKNGERIWTDMGAKPFGAIIQKIAPHV